MPPETDEAKESPKSEGPRSARGKAKDPKNKIAEVAVRLRKVTKRFGEKVATDGIVEVLAFAPHQVNEPRSRLGVLPQDALLPAGDLVGEFLTDMARLQGMTGAKAVGKARDALEEVEGKEWWALKCGALSHGMAKRVQLAQALLGDPDVVLLDEPTAGLDPRIAYEVRQLIKSRKGRCTLIVSSHNLQELEEICDAAAVLDRGRLVASGTMSELTASTEEVHFRVGFATAQREAGAKLPFEPVRALPMV
jgi:ABC-type multidrug transport system ATPase subunit